MDTYKRHWLCPLLLNVLTDSVAKYLLHTRDLYAGTTANLSQGKNKRFYLKSSFEYIRNNKYNEKVINNEVQQSLIFNISDKITRFDLEVLFRQFNWSLKKNSDIFNLRLHHEN